MKKRVNDAYRRYILLVAVAILLLVAVIIGINNKNITGMTTASESASLSVQIGNSAPTIYYVNLKSPAAPAAIESSPTQVNFTFLANDSDGASNLNNNAAMVNVLFNSSEENRTNSSCRYLNDVSGDAGSRNYSCTVYMQFYDAPVSWFINATINDSNSAQARNGTVTFSYGSTLAVASGPSSLIWNSFGVTAVNQLASNNPFSLNNTANSDIISVNVTAVDLGGNQTTSEYIYAKNFSINIANACDSGNTLTNSTNATAGVTWSTELTGGATKHGNNSKQDVYFCIEAVNSGISSQAYNATGANAWSVIADEN